MRLLLRPFLLILAARSHATAADPTARPNPFGLVLHGGAGVIDRRNLTPEREAELRAQLTEAREAGYAVLQRGGPALDAVIQKATAKHPADRYPSVSDMADAYAAAVRGYALRAASATARKYRLKDISGKSSLRSKRMPMMRE